MFIRYDYRCDCGHEIIDHMIKSEFKDIVPCPKCGRIMRRLINCSQVDCYAASWWRR